MDNMASKLVGTTAIPLEICIEGYEFEVPVNIQIIDEDRVKLLAVRNQ